MKGVVFNLLESVVCQVHGEDVWDDLLDRAGVSGSYTSLGNYPDAEMSALVGAAANLLSINEQDVLRWFGRAAMPVLAQRYESFFTSHASTRPFILSLNNIIHPEVRKIYPGADVPEFDFIDTDDGSLMMGYYSARKLCALAEGFVQGAADYYHETCQFEHRQCMHHGDDKCLFHISFQPA